MIQTIGTRSFIVTNNSVGNIEEGFIGATVCNQGGSDTTIIGSTGVAITLKAGQAFSFPQISPSLGYDAVTVDGATSACHVMIFFVVNTQA